MNASEHFDVEKLLACICAGRLCKYRSYLSVWTTSLAAKLHLFVQLGNIFSNVSQILTLLFY